MVISAGFADASLWSAIGGGRAGTWCSTSATALALAACVIATAAHVEVFAVAGQREFVVVACAAAEAEEKAGGAICDVFSLADGAIVVFFDMRGKCGAV